MANKKITDLTLRDDVTDDVNLPGDDGVQTYRVTAAQIFEYINGRLSSRADDFGNIQIQASVAGNALTIALKTKASANATTYDPIKIGFRSSTLTSGNFNARLVTGALSLVVSSGSTLGTTNATATYLYVYALDNAGSVELAVANSMIVDEGLLQSTTAEGGAGAADSASVLYSTTARTDVPIRLLGRIKISEATAGTWASAPTEISNIPFRSSPKNLGIAVPFTGSGTYTTPSDSTTETVYEYEMIGGGGGGGGSNHASGTASGGGSGAYAKGTFTGVAPGTAITITVGAAGTAGASTGTSGGVGGTSTVGSPVSVSCIGGSGGQGTTASSTTTGGAGGTVTGSPAIASPGGKGNNAYVSTSRGGNGAASAYGEGGCGGGASAGAGVAATPYGAGGGGAIGTTAGGGVGVQGFIVIKRLTA